MRCYLLMLFIQAELSNWPNKNLFWSWDKRLNYPEWHWCDVSALARKQMSHAWHSSKCTVTYTMCQTIDKYYMTLLYLPQPRRLCFYYSVILLLCDVILLYRNWFQIFCNLLFLPFGIYYHINKLPLSGWIMVVIVLYQTISMCICSGSPIWVFTVMATEYWWWQTWLLWLLIY